MNDEWTGAQAAPAQAQSSDRIRSYVTWNAGDLAKGIIGALALLFVLGTIAQVLVTNDYGEESPEAYFASFLATISWDIGFVILVIALVAQKGAGLYNLGFRKSEMPASSIAAWVIGGYFLLYGSVAVYNVIVTVLGLEFLEPSEQLPENVFDSTAVVAIAGVAIVLAAPIAEEVFFRGFLFPGLLRYIPMLPSALASGAIFSLAHGNIGLIIPFSIVGAILAWLYVKTNSLLTPILVHLLFNLTSFSILVLVPEAR